MTKLLLVLSVIVSFNVSAMELLSHKNTVTGITKLADSAVESLWASDKPACLKDGSTLIGVNAAFRKKALKYADCSSSSNAMEKQRMLGYEVAVVRFVELSDSMGKKVKGTK